jgi:hypothetical protein
MTKPLDGNAPRFTDAECENTIELEFSGEQVSALSRADAAIGPNPIPVSSAEKPLPNAPEDQRGARAALVLGISAASVLLGGIAYIATTRARPVDISANTVARSAAPEAAPAPPPTDNAPVRFTNPFDAAEVFEFPAGTSATEARHAVADLLLQRARGRQNSSSKMTRQRRKTADQVTSGMARGS